MRNKKVDQTKGVPIANDADRDSTLKKKPRAASETGGRKGLDPTRYGDWEKNGRCIDF